MIFIIIFIGFLILSNMSSSSYHYRRHPFYHDYPNRHDVENPYFQRPLPYFSRNTEGGYQQFQREQSLFFTMLFLMALMAFLFYFHQ